MAGHRDRLITIEAPSADEESVLGVLSMAGLDEVVIDAQPGRQTIHIQIYWDPTAGPAPAIDLSAVPTAKRLADRFVARSIWADDWTPQTVGPFWITPVAPGMERPSSPASLFPIYLEAGRGFGFAEHPSTQLALLAIADLADGSPPFGPTVFDVGSGTGILSLAAHHLGASTIWATDIDPQARAATAANAALNRTSIQTVEAWPEVPTDLVLANITPPVLDDLAPALVASAKPNGHIILSGMLESDARRLTPRYAPYTAIAEHRSDQWPGWVAVTFGRRTSVKFSA